MLCYKVVFLHKLEELITQIRYYTLLVMVIFTINCQFDLFSLTILRRYTGIYESFQDYISEMFSRY